MGVMTFSAQVTFLGYMFVLQVSSSTTHIRTERGRSLVSFMGYNMEDKKGYK
jgi:hypothetical protein